MERKTFYQFAAPSNILMVGLMIFPLIMAIWLGLQFLTFRNINNPEFIGLRNYIEVLTDARFWQSFRFTMLFTAISVPSQMIVGFVIALLLDQVSQRVRGLYIAMFLLPFIVVPVVGTLMFKQLFEPSGLAAWFFRAVLGQRFVFTEFSVKTLIIFHAIWYVTPFAIVTFFAGLQTLSQALIEAAQIDGCSYWKAFWRIDFPLAGPGIAASGIFAFLISWNEFAIANVLTRSLNSKTMPVGLFDFVFEFVMDWRGMCTLAVVMLVPAVIITFIIEKNLVRGLTFGALKG